jgi:acyl-CoA synthetase (AMP-forming)/AMP-acid ligase II
MILAETRFATDRGAGICVGIPATGVKVRIIPTREEVIETWTDDLHLASHQIGEITVSGENVTRKYYHREDATKLAKIYDPESKQFWHRMGDLGYFDERGRIWFCGRKAHRVILNRGTLYTIPCEAVFNTHPDIFRTALVGVEFENETYPVLCIELLPEARHVERRWLEIECRRLAQSQKHTKSIEQFLIHPSFPVDIRHNAKIFREKLAIWARHRLKQMNWRPAPIREPIELPPLYKGQEALEGKS